MTKKDYELLASVIREYYEETGTEVEQVTIRLFTYKLMTALKTDNYRFDREEFLNACLGQSL